MESTVPAINVLPLIRVQSDPTQPQLSSSVSNNQAHLIAAQQVLVTAGHNQVVTGHQVIVPYKKVQEEVDYRSTPQYQEFMKQKMLEMKKAEERRVRS